MQGHFFGSTSGLRMRGEGRSGEPLPVTSVFVLVFFYANLVSGSLIGPFGSRGLNAAL